MKISFFLATLISIVSINISSAAFAEKGSETLYNALSAPEEQFQYIYPQSGRPLLGVVRFQKSIHDLFCRKSAPPAPDRVYSYACFQKMSSIDAKSKFEAMNAILFRVIFHDSATGTPRLVPTVFERFDEQLVCQKTISSVEGLAPLFSCYEKLNL